MVLVSNNLISINRNTYSNFLFLKNFYNVTKSIPNSAGVYSVGGFAK